MKQNMDAVLFCKTGLFSGISFKIGHEATIGKSAGSNVALRSDIVSSHHAKIIFDDAQNSYFLEDLGSSNGTQLDGIRVKGKEKLGRLHIITFAGKYDFVFQVGGAIPSETEAPKSGIVGKAVEKTMMDKKEVNLPSFSKKEPDKEDKTMFEAVQEAPSPLPNFSRQPDSHKTVFDKSADVPVPLPAFGIPKEESKTMFDGAKDAPVGLPKFDQLKEIEVEESVSASPPQAILPAFQKQPEPTPFGSEARTEAMPPQETTIPAVNYGFALEVAKLNKNFDLKNGSTTIGRTIGCDIIIDDVSMSRKHAVVTVIGNKLTIRDLGSSNGTSVDKKRIGSEVEITPSSVIKLGMVDVRIKKVK